VVLGIDLRPCGAGLKDRLSGDLAALFIYGSLLFPEVLRALLGRVPDRAPATAEGWRIAGLAGRRYPGLVPASTHASGFVVTRLNVDEWRLLDVFEDDAYELRQIELDGRRSALTYVYPHVDALSVDWDRGHFADLHLASYVKSCRAWRERYYSSVGKLEAHQRPNS